MTHESAEIRPNESDIAHMAANLKGWELKEPQEQGSNRWVFGRQTAEGKHLALSIDTNLGEVDFNEWGENGVIFNIMCRKIRWVQTSYGDIRIGGDGEYEISSDGATHDISLNSDWKISKSYRFD